MAVRELGNDVDDHIADFLPGFHIAMRRYDLVKRGHAHERCRHPEYPVADLSWRACGINFPLIPYLFRSTMIYGLPVLFADPNVYLCAQIERKKNHEFSHYRKHRLRCHRNPVR